MLNKVLSIASTRGAFAALTEDGNIIPWGFADDGGVFNNNAEEQLKATKVKCLNFCIFLFLL